MAYRQVLDSGLLTNKRDIAGIGMDGTRLERDFS